MAIGTLRVAGDGLPVKDMQVFIDDVDVSRFIERWVIILDVHDGIPQVIATLRGGMDLPEELKAYITVRETEHEQA